MKVCTRCNKEKSTKEFNKCRRNKSGLRGQCKACMKEYRQENKIKIAKHDKQYYESNKIIIAAKQKQYCKNNKLKIAENKKRYYETNKLKISAYQKQYYIKNKKQLSEQKKQYRANNKEKIALQRKEYYLDNKNEISKYKKQYSKNNKEKIAVHRKKYYSDNKDAIIEHVKHYARERAKTDINFKLSRRLRTRLYHALKGDFKSCSAVNDLGCSIPELKTHLELKFQSGMTWENYGSWHIDHIKPLSKFDLTNREQLLEACHYTNLQPLWATDNLKKSNK